MMMKLTPEDAAVIALIGDRKVDDPNDVLVVVQHKEESAYCIAAFACDDYERLMYDYKSGLIAWAPLQLL